MPDNALVTDDANPQAAPSRATGPPASPGGYHSPLATHHSPAPLLAAWTLGIREWVRFVRQPNRVFGAIGQPLIFWLLFGVGLGPSFRLPGSVAASGMSYQEYFFPGSLILILLFTAIFATISIIEDRRE